MTWEPERVREAMGAYTRLREENAELRALLALLRKEYRYLRVRHAKTHLQHEERMRAIDRRMKGLGIEELT